MGVFKEMTRCLSFQNYRLYRTSTGGKNFLYLLMLSIIGFVLTIILGVCVPYAIEGGSSVILDKCPQFSMSSDGVLTVDGDYDINDGDTRFIVNTDYNIECDEENGIVYRDNGGELEELLDAKSSSNTIVIGANRSVLNTDGELVQMDYTNFSTKTRAKINNEGLADSVDFFFKALVILAFFFCIIRFAIWNIVNAIMGGVISSSMGVKNTFGQNYSMGMRAYTLPYIISCLCDAFNVGVPFKSVLVLCATGFILSRGIKAIKTQLEEEQQTELDTSSDESANMDLNNN
jgi:hypothetical protein